MEKSVGLPASPFMDRDNTPVSKCQSGFIKIIVTPLYEAWQMFARSDKGKLAVDNCIMNLEQWNVRRFVRCRDARCGPAHSGGGARGGREGRGADGVYRAQRDTPAHPPAAPTLQAAGETRIDDWMAAKKYTREHPIFVDHGPVKDKLSKLSSVKLSEERFYYDVVVQQRQQAAPTPSTSRAQPPRPAKPTAARLSSGSDVFVASDSVERIPESASPRSNSGACRPAQTRPDI